MKTLHRLWILFAAFIAVSFACSQAHAQVWTTAPNTTPLAGQTDQLPFSVTVDWIVPEPWLAVNGTSWQAIWPRNATGAWYRPPYYTQTSIYRNKVYTWAYSCKLGPANGFICRDLVRGIDRTVACPASIVPGGIRLWRSQYVSSWPELGLFTGDVGPFAAAWQKSIAFQARSVTANGQQINCSYGPPTVGGSGTALDLWVFRR